MPPGDGPTAIIPARPGSFEERWDLLARRLGDPLARLFMVNASTSDEELAIRSSDVLLSYRHPKKRASDAPASADRPPVVFNINLGPATRTIDVTPSDPLLK